MPGDMALIEIADTPQERRVYTVRCVFNPLGTIIGIEYVLWNIHETIPYAYVRYDHEVKPVNTYTLF